MAKRRSAQKNRSDSNGAPNAQLCELLADIPAHGESALAALVNSIRCAEAYNLNSWDLAIELGTLEALGLNKSDCRRLILCGVIRHGYESSTSRGDKRTFRQAKGLKLRETSCFVLSEDGFELLNQLNSNSRRNQIVSESGNSKPHWNADTRELTFHGELIKQFKSPADNQEVILHAFQEDKWPRRIDDPLPQKHGRDPKRRLHDTIVSLNRKHKQSLIRFFGDGTGEGICWKVDNGS